MTNYRFDDIAKLDLSVLENAAIAYEAAHRTWNDAALGTKLSDAEVDALDAERERLEAVYLRMAEPSVVLSLLARVSELEAAVASKEAEGRKSAAEVCRVKAHGWRNEANTLEPDTDEWRELIAKADAGYELSAFLNKKAGSDAEGQ